METIKSISKGIKAITTAAVVATLALSVQAHQIPTVDANVNAPHAPTYDTSVTKGKECTTKPFLTDTIVVLDSKGATRIMTFDDTLAATKAGTVTVITYCQ